MGLDYTRWAEAEAVNTAGARVQNFKLGTHAVSSRHKLQTYWHAKSGYGLFNFASLSRYGRYDYDCQCQFHCMGTFSIRASSSRDPNPGKTKGCRFHPRIFVLPRFSDHSSRLPLQAHICGRCCASWFPSHALTTPGDTTVRHAIMKVLQTMSVYAPLPDYVGCMPAGTFAH